MSTSTHPSPLSARLRVLAAAALFSSGGAVIKAISFSGWQVASFRSGVAVIALFLLMPEARRRPSLKVLAVGFSYASTMILFVQANKLTTAASTIFLQSTAPLYVLLLSPWLLQEKVRPRDLVYMAVLGAGLALFFVGLDPVSATAPNPLLGNVLALLSGLFWATTIMGLRALGRRTEEGGSWGPAAALWGSVLAFTMCLPMALPVTQSRPVDWLLVGFLGVFQIAIAYMFLLRGLENVRALEASLLLLGEPVLNPVWAWLTHGERPGAWSLAGGAVILLSTVVKSVLDTRTDAAATSPP
ncbi:MAG TPA: EamA family transporter [Thermoanaerobaculia bacterium]|nr:EamA family transporter [Thermoanaerobaculia bacterium]